MGAKQMEENKGYMSLAASRRNYAIEAKLADTF